MKHWSEHRTHLAYARPNHSLLDELGGTKAQGILRAHMDRDMQVPIRAPNPP